MTDTTITIPDTRPTGIQMPQTVTEGLELARTIADSVICPKSFKNKQGKGDVGAVFAAIELGCRLNLPVMTALGNIAVINGRACIWGDLMLALVKTHPEFLKCEEVIDDHQSTCTVMRKGQPVVERVFTLRDAEQAGLTRKAGPWQDYPKRMLQMRARAFALRDSFPDALAGLASREEVEDYIDGGELESKPVEPEEGSFTAKAKPEPEPEPKPDTRPEPEAEPEAEPALPHMNDAEEALMAELMRTHVPEHLEEMKTKIKAAGLKGAVLEVFRRAYKEKERSLEARA